MAKNELIKYAGYSVSADGKMRFRTATTEHRINQLCDLGEDVNMISITPVATKSEAAKELIRLEYLGKRPEVVAFFVSQVRDENPFRAKKARTVTVKQSEVATNGRGVFAKVFPEIPMTPKQAEKIREEFNAKNKDLV